MIRLLFILFILVPIIEMVLLIKVGSLIGAGATILLVLLTAVIGAILLRLYSFQLIMDIRQKLERGELPAKSMLEGVLLAVGGTLLLTPGFFTDAVGFACLIPVSRSFITQLIINAGWVRVVGASDIHTTQQEAKPYVSRNTDGSTTIEGEYTREDN